MYIPFQIWAQNLSRHFSKEDTASQTATSMCGIEDFLLDVLANSPLAAWENSGMA